MLSGASGSLTGGGYLAGRELVNEGTTTLGSGMVNMSEGAQIRNSGVLKTDPAYGWDGFRFSPTTGGTPSILNTGTFEKSAGSGETEVEVNFENEETTASQHTGLLEFRQGTTTLAETTVCSKALSGSPVQALSGTASTGRVQPSRSPQVRLVSKAARPATIGGFAQTGGTLTGAGTLEIYQVAIVDRRHDVRDRLNRRVVGSVGVVDGWGVSSRGVSLSMKGRPRSGVGW